MSEKRWLSIILGLFVTLGVTYALLTPVFEASDELWHYPMVRHLADGNPLPVQVFDPALAGPWNQEASQPPLYYYLGAALTFWIDTSDMEAVRWQNPHVDNGVITADGNNNLIVHDPVLSPWQGTLLAVRIVRIFSVFLGAVTVYLTYLIAKSVVPNREEIVLGVTAVTAFMPMFLFISGAVNNDNLIIPLAALSLLIMIRMVDTIHYPLSTIHFILLGIVIGLAALTKLSGIGLLPLAWGTIFVTRWQQSDGEVGVTAVSRWLIETTLRFLLVLLPVLLIAGWWYARNVQLYGDWRGWSAFIAVLGQRAHPASLRQLWAERWGFMLSYWGLFGGVNIPMPLWIYRFLNSVLVVAVIGFPIYLIKVGTQSFAENHRGTQRKSREKRWGESKRLLHNSQNNLRLSTIHYLQLILSFITANFALVLILLWAGAVVYGIVDWATITWSSQGRLVFSALPALSTLFILGLVGWLPKRPARWIVGILATFMLVVAAAAPFLWIGPAYQPSTVVVPLQNELDVTFGEQIRLTGFELGETATSAGSVQAVFPGDTLELELTWEALAPMGRNWSVFIHLNDPVLGQPIAQRDMYLGQGLLATSFLQPGDRMTNRYVLTIPETAVAPAELELIVGLYDFDTGERLSILPNQDSVQLQTIMLEAAAGETPNPTSINFGDEVTLLGFEVAPRRVNSGETVELILYVAGKRPLATNYTFFAQVVDAETTRWAAHDFAPPLPTSDWQPDDVQTIRLSLTLRDDTPSAVYPIIIGMYTQTEDGQFERLQVITEDGRPTDDFLQLTLLRVE